MKIITTDEEIKELPLPTLNSEGVVVLPPKIGRPEGKKVSRLEKEIIAVHSNLGMNQDKLAEIMGTSQTEVSIVKRGLNHSELEGQKKDEDLEALGLQAKHKIIDLASTKLLKSLKIFNPDAIEQKELPGAATKLASVVEKFSGNRENSGNQINFIVYQPRQKNEEDFGDVLVLNER